MPSRRHRSLTVTSRRKPSRTIRIFSSGVYLRRVMDLTRRTKDLVSWLRSSAASALSVSDWDTSALFVRPLYPHFRSPHHLRSLGFSSPQMCPIIAERLQLSVNQPASPLLFLTEFGAGLVEVGILACVHHTHISMTLLSNLHTIGKTKQLIPQFQTRSDLGSGRSDAPPLLGDPARRASTCQE